MKRYVSVVFFILFSMISHAQKSMSENELKKYFENNIQNLHPLEGLYFMKNSHNLFFKDETITYTRAFIFSKNKNSYEELYFDKDTGRYKYLQQVLYDSSTHLFRYVSTNDQYLVRDPSHFTLNKSDQYTYDYEEYVKLYPTSEMYNEIASSKRYKETTSQNNIQKAWEYIDNESFSSALAILNELIKTEDSYRNYYCRANAYFGLKDYNAAIQDCNKALSYNISSNNANIIRYLRGLCFFMLNNIESGISDMRNAGEDGAKFLEEYAKEQSSQKVQTNSQNRKNNKTTRQNRSTPILKKTK